jgi:hypothetical protein
MNTEIITEIFEEVEPAMNDHHREFNALMRVIKPTMTPEMWSKIEGVVNLRVYDAMQSAFTVGIALGMHSTPAAIDEAIVEGDLEELLKNALTKLAD